MDNLPDPILVHILGRVADSTDLARCRLTSRRLRSLSYDVKSISVICSIHRFLRSLDPDTAAATLPFKTLVQNLVSLLQSRSLESLTLGVERPFAAEVHDEFDERGDLHLTDVTFLSHCLRRVGGKLRELTVSDFWTQSCWRRSEVLEIISSLCEKLLSLEVRNAWLSVDGLKPFALLKKLTLEYIRLDDEDLTKLNECFPSLEVLNLLGVGGLNEPKILLPNLKVCCWTVSDVPLSLSVCAPRLIELKLRCVNPNLLIIKTPLLSRIDLIVEKQIGVIEVGQFLSLKFLRIEASALGNLIEVFTGCSSIKFLEIETLISTFPNKSSENVSFEDLARLFPNVDDLKLGQETFAELERSFAHGYCRVGSQWESLKKMTLSLPPLDFDFAFLYNILDACTSMHEVVVIFCYRTPNDARDNFKSNFGRKYPKIKWKWMTGK